MMKIVLVLLVLFLLFGCSLRQENAQLRKDLDECSEKGLVALMSLRKCSTALKECNDDLDDGCLNDLGQYQASR